MKPLDDARGPANQLRKRSLHVVCGHRCQNDCLFCSDGGARIRGAPPTPETVRSILEQNRDHEVVCFSSHEPTLNPDLVTYVQWAQDLGFDTISLITNGRLLARDRLVPSLVNAGLNDLHISIQGHKAAVADAITRRPGSFEQAIAGLEAALAVRTDHALRVTIHSTISALNVEHLPDMIEFFLSQGIDHYGLNGLFIEGLADEHFEFLSVPYEEITDILAGALSGPPRSVSISDIPPCRLIGRIPPWAIGLREDFHVAQHEEDGAPGDDVAMSVQRGYSFGPDCDSCACRTQCDGVSPAYIERYGWESFQPVLDQSPAAFETQARLEDLLSSPSWSIKEIHLESLRARIHLIAPGLSDDLVLILEPLDPDRPAYRRSRHYNISLKGTGHDEVGLAIAEEVAVVVREREKP